jgi:hypothetical protein
MAVRKVSFTPEGDVRLGEGSGANLEKSFLGSREWRKAMAVLRR